MTTVNPIDNHFGLPSGSGGYQMPIIDGTVGQTLVTDGAGTVSWNTIINPSFNQPAANVSTSGPTAGVTGNGAIYNFICDIVLYDNTSSYNLGTGVYTIPIDGLYNVFMRVPIGNISAGMTNGTIGFSGTFAPTYLLNSPVAIKDNNNICDLQFNYTRKFTAGDTIQPFIQINGGGGDTATVDGGASVIITYLGPNGVSGGGDVIGPGSAVDGDIVLFDGTSGKLIKDSGFQITTGTFVPVLDFGGNSVGITYNVQSGEYTQIGNLVFYEVNINLSSKGSSVGAAGVTLTGLPNAGGIPSNLGSLSLSDFTFTATYTWATVTISSGSNIALLRQNTDASTLALSDTNFGNNAQFAFAGFYFTS